MLFKVLGPGDKKVNVAINSYKANPFKKSASKFQKRVKDFLFKNFGGRGYEIYEELPIGQTQLRVDFMVRINGNKCIFIEADSVSAHSKFTPFFHKTEEKYLESLDRDSYKDVFAEINNIPMIRIYDDDDLTLEWFNETFDYPLSPF